MIKTYAIGFGVLGMIAGCAAQQSNTTSTDFLEARLTALEASLKESQAAQERLTAALDDMRRPREQATPSVAPPPVKMKKSPQLPIRRLSTGEESPVVTESEQEETVADSRHEGLYHYRQGYQLLKEDKPEQALDALAIFLKENPDHVYADRAQYLIAEGYLRNREFGLALVAVNRLEKEYPSSFRLGDGRYVRALALLAMGEKSRGKEVLKEILRQHSTEPVSEVASRKLAELSVTRDGSREHVPLLPSAG